jgi:hypothetical protein
VSKVKCILSPKEAPAGQKYVLVIYGEEYAETEHPPGPYDYGCPRCVCTPSSAPGPNPTIGVRLRTAGYFTLLAACSIRAATALGLET